MTEDDFNNLEKIVRELVERVTALEDYLWEVETLVMAIQTQVPGGVE